MAFRNCNTDGVENWNVTIAVYSRDRVAIIWKRTERRLSVKRNPKDSSIAVI